MMELVSEHFPDHRDYVERHPVLFGDYRNALMEEPYLYEDMVYYDAAKAILEEVKCYVSLLGLIELVIPLVNWSLLVVW